MVSGVEPTVHFGSAQRLEYRFDDGISSRKHIAVPEPHYSIAIRPNECVAARVIAGLINVLATIELDNQLRLKTD
jgi:hypothetical protein